MERKDLTGRKRQIHDVFWKLFLEGGNPGSGDVAAAIECTPSAASSVLRDLRCMNMIPRRPVGSHFRPPEWDEPRFHEKYPGAVEFVNEQAGKPLVEAFSDEQPEAAMEEEPPGVISTEDILYDDLLSKLQKKKDKVLSLEELADEFDVSPRRIRDAANYLEKGGYNVLIEDGHIGLTRRDDVADETSIPTAGQRIRFGAISDTHLCSKQERLDVLNSLYDWYAEEGIEDVYLAGNMIEGESRFNVREVHTFGLDAQVNYFIDKFPQRPGITTHYVAGDDHEGWYQQREGISIGRYIQSAGERAGRDDLHYLGYMEHDIAFKNEAGEFIMRVAHPGGGSAYALSYKPQKLVESFQGGEKPAVLLIGHYHKMEYLPAVRNVRVFQLGCTVDQSVWARKKSLDFQLGGWLIELVQCERTGACIGCKAEDRTFFDRKFYAKWED